MSVTNEGGEKIRFVNYEDFVLNKLTYNEKKQLLVVDWEERTGSKDGHLDTPKETPHPDLLTALDALKPHLARVLGLQKGWDFAREEFREDPDNLKRALSGVKDADNSVKVIGITILGEGETEGVKIEGFLSCLNGQMKVNCPVIRFRSEAMAIEGTVEKLIEAVRVEAYAFLHQKKRKQYTLEEQEEIDRKRLKIKKTKKQPKNQTNLIDQANEAEKEKEADLAQ